MDASTVVPGGNEGEHNYERVISPQALVTPPLRDFVFIISFLLKRAFGPSVNGLFKRSMVSDWGRNPYARGSYSYIAVGGSGRDYDELAWPVGVASTRVFFAGEHTNGQHPATATGAFISGLREAQRIDEAARGGFAAADGAGSSS